VPVVVVPVVVVPVVVGLSVPPVPVPGEDDVAFVHPKTKGIRMAKSIINFRGFILFLLQVIIIYQKI